MRKEELLKLKTPVTARDYAIRAFYEEVLPRLQRDFLTGWGETTGVKNKSEKVR